MCGVLMNTLGGKTLVIALLFGRHGGSIESRPTSLSLELCMMFAVSVSDPFTLLVRTGASGLRRGV